jgi:hypothetical protein
VAHAIARAKFRRYWAFLSPGIILIRRSSLGPLEREAGRRAFEGRTRERARERGAATGHLFTAGRKPITLWTKPLLRHGTGAQAQRDQIDADEREAAAHIGMSVAFLRAARLGRGTPGPPFVRIGRAVRYAAADLDA